MRVFKHKLTAPQQSLWLEWKLNPESTAYNLPYVFKLKGILNINALSKALHLLVERHDSLRTYFKETATTPLQVISSAVDFKLNIIDLCANLHDDNYAKILAETISLQYNTPFDLQTLPLFRFSIIKESDEVHYFILNFHHIIVDGSSAALLLQELSDFYNTLLKKNEVILAPTDISMSQMLADESEYLYSEQYPKDMAKWQSLLTDANFYTQLPKKFSGLADDNSTTYYFKISKSLTKSLKTLVHNEHSTLFISLMACFKLLLFRYTGQEDITINYTVNTRAKNSKNFIGYFVNLFYSRTQFHKALTFADLIKLHLHERRVTPKDRKLPLVNLIRALRQEDQSRETLICNVDFGATYFGRKDLFLQNIEVEAQYTDLNDTQIELSFQYEEEPDGIIFKIWYSNKCFDRVFIENMGTHFSLLLAEIVKNPNQLISHIPLLSSEEKNKLLVEWNATLAEYPRDKTLQQLFEAQVECTPNHIAATFENKSLTYQELNSKANQLAHYLRMQYQLDQGEALMPDTLIAIAAERNLEMIIGILGILKAGAAYVPIDPDYPAHRIEFMLQDCAAKYVLTQEKLIAHLQPILSDLQIKPICISLDQHSPIIATLAKDNPPVINQTNNLVYIIYTSGSTGKPKGVAVPHPGVIRLVKNTNYIEIKSTDCIAQIANISFDAATFEIWGALLNGAHVTLFSKELLLDTNRFKERMKEQKVSCLFLTSALFNNLMLEDPTILSNADKVLFGGETIEPTAARIFLKNHVNGQLLHVYGPTECTTFSSYYLIEDVSHSTRTIPIGKPLSNVQFYVADNYLQLVPIGIIGELYIGGDGLARSYLNRSDLTEQRFIPNPFNDDPHSRLYKTGDLVRWLPDGNLEYIGRNDDQVKIRGFRIELGEIEAQLLSHPQVRQCVVLVKTTAEDKRLIAYLVPEEKDHLDGQMLRDFLKQNLPDYMIPSAFMLLDALPLTPNGKIDKKALAQQEVNYLTALTHYVAARSPEEQALIAIWAEVLKLNPDSIGIHDNFFTLGGHSLFAISIVSRIRILFQVKLPLKNLFDYPTVSSLIEHIHQLRNAEHKPSVTRPRLTRRPG